MSPPSNKANKGYEASGFPPKRISDNRPVKTRILIVGEGQQTEPNYFRGLKEEPAVREKFTITVECSRRE